MSIVHEKSFEASGQEFYQLRSSDAEEGAGLVVNVLAYGATITNLFVKDREGITRDVVLGFDAFEGFADKANRYFGAAIGRCSNRIEKGHFELNGTAYQLALNNGPNNLHGGDVGFDKRTWTVTEASQQALTLTLISPDGEESFPGKLEVTLRYRVKANELHMDYEASLASGETLETIVNLTNHSYFNLGNYASEEAAKITDHLMTMSDAITGYLEKDATGIPTGEIKRFQTPSIAGGPMDFGASSSAAAGPHSIGSRIDETAYKGYDYCYVIDQEKAKKQAASAKDTKTTDDAMLQTPPLIRVWSPETAIRLSFSTSEPGVQFYSGDFITDAVLSKTCQTGEGRPKVVVGKRGGFALEAQRFPDAINKKDWRHQVVLKPGQKYTQHTMYKFDLVN